MAYEVSVYRRKQTTKSGTKRAGWSAGTAYTAVVRDGARTRQFYAASQPAAQAKAREWIEQVGWQGELRDPRTNRFRPAAKQGPTDQATPPALTPAADWLLEWASSGRRSREEWQTRRKADVLSLIRRFVVPAWSSLPLAGVTPSKVDELLDTVRVSAGGARGNYREGQVALTTQDNLRRVLRTAFKDLLIEANADPSFPLKRNPVPRPPKEVREAKRQAPPTFRILTTDEWRALARACTESSDPLASCILLMLETGLRSEEARALRWADFNEATGMLRVERAVIRGEQGDPERRLRIVEITKSAASKRTIPVPPLTRRALHIARYIGVDSIPPQRGTDGKCTSTKTEPAPFPDPSSWRSADEITDDEFAEISERLQEAAGDRDRDIDALMWPAWGRYRKDTLANAPLDGSRLHKALAALRQAAGIAELACPTGDGDLLTKNGDCILCRKPARPLRIHDLRHSHCSMLLHSGGVDQATICQRMGWKGPAMLARYGHASTDSAQAAAAKIAAITGQLDDLR